jgi:hypothetical protein
LAAMMSANFFFFFFWTAFKAASPSPSSAFDFSSSDWKK